MDSFYYRTFVFFLSVAGCCFGQMALPPGPVEGVLGKNVTFKTTVSTGDVGNFLTMSWSFNGGSALVPVVTYAPGGTSYGNGYGGRVSLNSTNGVLILGPLTAKDSGQYSVSMISNQGVTKTGETSLKVLEPVSGVTITSSLAEAIELNSTVVLTCTSKGSFLKYSWINGTAPVVVDGTHISQSADSSNLTVNGVLRTDLVGPIYCTASNTLESGKSAPFNLTVHYGPENIAMKASPADEVIRKGSNLTLTCSVQSSPVAEYMWIHNGAVRKETGPTLVLANVNEGHTGNITCSAFNAKTKRYLTAPLVRFTVIEGINGTKIIGPTATLVAGNGTASLRCSATAGTIASRIWMKDGKPLVPSNRINVTSDLVTISPVQKEDNGVYTCQLTNAISTETATQNMVVNYGPESVKVTGKTAVEVTDPVKLTCTAFSIPASTYAWKFNETLLGVTSAEYSIESAVYKDTGIYTCEARNAVTGLSSSYSHLLSVKEEGALEEEGLTDGAKAGIIIGVLVLLAAIIAGVIYMRKKRTIESPY